MLGYFVWVMVLVLGLVLACGEGLVWGFMVVAFALRVVFRWCGCKLLVSRMSLLAVLVVFLVLT